MAAFRIACIAAIACCLVTLGQAHPSWQDWPFPSSHAAYQPRGHHTLAARDWLYPGLGQNSQDSFFDSGSDWFISALNKLYPDFGGNVDIDDSQFQVKVSMVGFTKDEVTVRVKDGFVAITGKHEPSSKDDAVATDKEDSYKQFTYKYSLPEDTIVEEMKSRLTSEGVLIVSAPRSGIKKADKGYEVPVHTDEQNTVPTTKKLNEFYDEDSAEKTTQAAEEHTEMPVISIDDDGNSVKYEFVNV